MIILRKVGNKMFIKLPSLTFVIYYLVKIILYCAAAISLTYSFGDDIVAVLKSLRKKSVFRKMNTEHNKLYLHIEKIFYVLYGAGNNKRVNNFFVISAVFFLIPFVLLRNNLNFIMNIVLSGFASLLPYVYLRLNLYKVRVESSFDAELVISEIANQYKICNLNMREAIRRAEKYLTSAPYSRRNIYSLALMLDVYKTDEELKKYLDYFVYSLNTQWARLLANNIYFAIAKDFDVSEGLSDILKDIRNSVEAEEKANRENAESFILVFFMAPFLLVLTPFLADKLFDFSLSKFVYYQFNTPLGIALFFLLVILLVFDFLIVYFLKRRKFDI